MNQDPVMYYRLLDPQHKGVIVKMCGRIQHRYEPSKGWIRTGIMLDYLWPDSDTFERYEEISETEVLALTGGVS